VYFSCPKHNKKTHPFIWRPGITRLPSSLLLTLVTVTPYTSTVTTLPGAVSLSLSLSLAVIVSTSPSLQALTTNTDLHLPHQNSKWYGFCFINSCFSFLELLAVVLIFVFLYTVGFIKSITTSLASSTSYREILQCLCNSRRSKKEWKEHILLGLLHQYLPSLSVSSRLSPSLAGSFKTYLLRSVFALTWQIMYLTSFDIFLLVCFR